MSEVRIEKVENGYIIRCFNSTGKEDYVDTYVYSSFTDVVEFLSIHLNEERNFKIKQEMEE